MISRARKKNKQIICGGDFQTEFDPSLHRGMLLMHWAESNSLIPANVQIDSPWNDVGTFESNLGRRRQIDFIFIDQKCKIVQAFGSNILDLGSDHRTVIAEFFIDRRSWSQSANANKKKKKKQSMKGWKPRINDENEAYEYHKSFDKYSNLNPASSLYELGANMVSAAQESDSRRSENNLQ